jgi:virginiamycin B lyase
MGKGRGVDGLGVLAKTLLVVTAFGCASESQPEVVEGVQGFVLDDQGGAVAGAFVTAQFVDGTLSHTVVSDETGRYLIPLSDPEVYELRAKREAGSAYGAGTLLEFNADGVAVEGDVVVSGARADWHTAPARAVLSRLPSGQDKRKLILDCTSCHQFDQIVVGAEDRLKTEDEWRTWAIQMIDPNPNMSPSRDAAETASWLTSHLPPEPGSTTRPELVWPSLPVSADAPRAVVTEYEIPVPEDLPHDVKVDVDGRVLVTGQLTGLMYLLDPSTGEIAMEEVPTEFANPRAIDIDDAGNWYIALGATESIARKDRATGEWDIRFVDMHPHSIQLAPDGAIWYNGHFTRDPERIGRIAFDEEEPRPIVVPSDPMPDGGITMQYGLRLGPDGTVWTTQLMGGRLVRYDPPTGDFRLYDLPTEASGPRRPDVGADGRVWIPEYANNRLAVFDPETETFHEYEMPVPDMLPYVVRVDRTRDLVWIGTSAADALIRFDPSTERFDVFPLPMKGAIIRHLDIDESSGDVWGSYGAYPSRGRNRIVRLRLY